MSWDVSSAFGAPQFWVLPEHSRKWTRDADGNRVMCSMVKMSGRSTNPCTISRCSDGSMVGTPATLIMQAVRGDNSAKAWSGVRLNEDNRVGGSGKPWR